MQADTLGSRTASIDQALDLGRPGSAGVLVGLAALDDLDDESHAEYFLKAPLEIRP